MVLSFDLQRIKAKSGVKLGIWDNGTTQDLRLRIQYMNLVFSNTYDFTVL